MTNAEKLNLKVFHWLGSDNADDTFAIDNRVFRLEWDGDIYSIYENDEQIGWNDNHKDFRKIGKFIFG
jgi:hypothetical protein